MQYLFPILSINNGWQKSTYRVIVAEPLPLSTSSEGDGKGVVVELLQPAPSTLAKPNDDAVISGLDIASSLSALANQGDDAGNDGTAWPRDFVALNKITNTVVWLKTVRPGEKVQLNFSYRITWPAGKEIKII